MKMSLVDLGKRLLEAARKGEDDEVRKLMASGAPFTTDWVCHCNGCWGSVQNGLCACSLGLNQRVQAVKPEWRLAVDVRLDFCGRADAR